MRLAVITAGLLMASLGGSGAALPGPRVAPGQWAIDYAKDSCILSRDGIGTAPGIAIRTRPFARDHDLMVYLPRTSEKERVIKGWLAIDARSVGAERWIGIAQPTRARRLIETRISPDELALLAGAQSIRLSSNAGLDVAVPLAMIGKAMAALRACEIELAGRWGVDQNAMKDWSRTAFSPTDLRELFWDKDVRKSVILRHPVRALLDIDETGTVTNCRITQSSRVSWADIKFCETLRRDVKFQPALDLSGKAVKSIFVTPEITSALLRP